MSALTTTAAVKAYLAMTGNGSDALIASLIARETAVIENYTVKEFPAVTRTLQRLHGTGAAVQVLPDTPILSVSYLAIDGTEIPVSADGLTRGYMHDETALYLIGGEVFPYGRQNVVCSWSAGYTDTETAFIPSGNTPTLTPTAGGRAGVNVSVTRVSTGAAMTQVGSAPATGQYSFADGTYTFAAADSGVQVTMAYQYIPAPIEQACIEMVAVDLKSRDNVGVRSRTLAGESVSYTSGSITVATKQMIDPYRKRVPA